MLSLLLRLRLRGFRRTLSCEASPQIVPSALLWQHLWVRIVSCFVVEVGVLGAGNPIFCHGWCEADLWAFAGHGVAGML